MAPISIRIRTISSMVPSMVLSLEVSEGWGQFVCSAGVGGTTITVVESPVFPVSPWLLVAPWLSSSTTVTRKKNMHRWCWSGCAVKTPGFPVNSKIICSPTNRLPISNPAWRLIIRIALCASSYRPRIILWVLGFVSAYTMGGFIHILLVIAVVMILLQVIQGRRL